MQRKIHMHDQVYNKVEDIMNHYKRKPILDLVRVIKQMVRKTSAA